MKKYLLALMALFVILIPAIAAAQSSEPDFGSVSSFRNKWLEQDRLVGASGVTRPYTWGPNVPSAPTTLSEDYAESPGGKRRVLYLDKARMEINNPTDNFVTTGLAVKELVSGLRQDGNARFTQFAASETQVAGDPVSVNQNAPVYRSFKGLVTLGNADDRSKPSAIGTSVTAFVSKDGTTSAITPPETITISNFDSLTGHNIAKPFADFRNIRGPVTDPVSGSRIENQPIYTVDPISNVFGYAISEPYWVTTKIAGTERTVLVQLFERRVLTYNPALTGASKVEMGNLGQHYYNWRYVEITGQNPTTPPPSTTPVPTTPAVPLDYSQARANYNKTSSTIPLGAPASAGNVQSYGAGSVISSSAAVDLNKNLAVFGTNATGVHGINITNLANVFVFKPLNSGTPVSFNSEPEIYNSTIYVGGGDGRVYALDETASGSSITEKDKTSAAGAAVAGLVIAPDAKQLFYTAGGSLYAASLANLSVQNWVVAPGGTLTAPVIDKDGNIYVGSSDGKLHAYKTDGTKAANFPINLEGALDDPATLANNSIYVGTNAGYLYKLNPTTGGTVWRTQVAPVAAIDSVPAFSGGSIYVGTGGKKVHKLNDSNGSVTSTFDADGAVDSSVAVVDGFYYFGDNTGKLYKVDSNITSNKTELASGAGTFGFNSPVVAGGKVFIASSGPSGNFYIVK